MSDHQGEFEARQDRLAYYEDERATQCRSESDGECWWGFCPQMRDEEPRATGRHCPLDRLPWVSDNGREVDVDAFMARVERLGAMARDVLDIVAPPTRPSGGQP